MEIAPLVAALETLRAQHEDVVANEQQLTAELELLRGVRRNMETAMRSIEALVVDPSTWKSLNTGDRTAPKVTVRVAEPSELIDNAVAENKSVNSPPPAQLAPYLAAGGKRLKSKRMLFDLLQKVPELVTRDELKRLFFEHYGRENLERYWARPDNALNTAIDRAVTDSLIEELPNTSGGPPYYSSGWRNSETGEPAFPVHEEDD